MKKQILNEEWLFSSDSIEKEVVTIPHDAMQVQGRAADSETGQAGAYFLGGKYSYEKKIYAPNNWKNQVVIIELEGVYPEYQMYLNGKMIGECKYGYSQSQVVLDELKYGEYNNLCIEVDNSDVPNSRWYTGAGIYRPVWLWLGKKEYIKPDGVRITTLSTKPAEIRIDVEHTKEKCDEKDIQIELYWDGKKISEGFGNNLEIGIENANLWSAKTPNLYQCIVTLREGDEVLDQHSTYFGIRKIEWSINGFTVNGDNVLLKGGCLHHDNGILGARSYAEAEWRRIKRLKESGFNAIRSSHYPLCMAALEACDTLGMYVMDETWDMWNVSKSKFDYAKDFIENYEFDLDKIVKKDFNHPSVIMYSIGNEVSEPATEEGLVIAEKIINKLKKLDSTRPITAGINLAILLMSSMNINMSGGGENAPSTEKMDSTAYNKMVSEMGNKMLMASASEGADKISTPILDMLDIAGYNYASSRYEMEIERHPDRIVVGTETYTYDLAKNWELVEKLPYVIGDFMWTAWDYLGEVGIGAWSYAEEDMGFHKKYPWLLSSAGIFDILGNETGGVGLARTVWEIDKKPYIGVSPVNHPDIIPNKAIWSGSKAMPHWSYKGCDGYEAEIEVYSRAKEVELFVNGVLKGRKEIENCRACFITNYEQGELKVVAYNEDGSYHSESILQSADNDTQIVLRVEESITRTPELTYIDISLCGNNGVVECNNDTLLKINVVGGEVLAFGSANPKTEESYLSGEFTTYYGKAQAIIKKSNNGMRVVVSGDNLETATLII